MFALPSADDFALQRLLRHREGLVDDRTRVILRIHSEIEPIVPELPAVLPKGQPSALVRFLLRAYLHPKRASAAGVDGIRSAARGANLAVDDRLVERWVSAATHAWRLWQPLEASDRCPIDFDVSLLVVRSSLDLLSAYDRRIDAIDTKIRERYAKLDQARVIETIPGIGPVVGPAILAIVGNIERFANVKRFVSWCGLAPKKNQTGTADRRGQHITKAGNRTLRRYLYLAADVARRTDPELAAWYQRQTSRQRTHTDVVTAIAAKLARRVYAVLKRARHDAEASYVIRDGDGRVLDKRTARRMTSERFPSKSERAKRDRDEKSPGAGQSRNSPEREPAPAPSQSIPRTRNPAATGVPPNVSSSVGSS